MDFSGLIATAKEWQELIGAVLGGFFSLCVALLVAHAAKRSDETAAARLLQADLARLVGMMDQLHKVIKDHGYQKDSDEDAYNRCAVLLLCGLRWRMSSIFEESMYRVLMKDLYVDIPLPLACSCVREIEPILQRLEGKVVPNSHATGPDCLLPYQTDVNTIIGGYEDAKKHADFAIHALQTMVISPFSLWHWMRRTMGITRSWEKEFQREYLLPKDEDS